MLLTMYVFLVDFFLTINQRGISSCLLAPRYIINPKPYKSWNTFLLRRAVPLASRIAQMTEIVSLHYNTHLNAMVGLLRSLCRAAY